MRSLILLIVLLLVFVLFSVLLVKTDLDLTGQNENLIIQDLPKKKNKGIGSHAYERLYFSEWNHPYTEGVPANVKDKIWQDLKSLPSENRMNPNVTNSWILIGPSGITLQEDPTVKYTGRVKDVEPPRGSVGLRIGAASGGIWGYTFLFPVNISNGIESAWLGTFATDPADPNIIFAGTGEPDTHSNGRGLWKTTNGGQTWFKDSFAGFTPQDFYKIRFDRNNPNIVHAACGDGYFRSDNRGANWVRKYTGSVTDFETVYGNQNIIYIAEKNPGGSAGILKSTNGGNNFIRFTLSANGLPDAFLERSVIATGKSPNIVYTVLGDLSGKPKGVYKSTNSGLNWTNISPPASTNGYWDARVEYKNMITVCPADPNIVMVGTTFMLRSANGGLNWVLHAEDALHADHHRMEWKDDFTVYSANDGGIAVSTDRGITWTTTINNLPITQFYDFDVGVNNKNAISGGTQDNGAVLTQNLGQTWKRIACCDVGGYIIDPGSSSSMFMTQNAAGNISFLRHRTTNYGINWTAINSGLAPHNDWVPSLESDKTPPIYLYTNGGSYMYKSTNRGDNWVTMNSTPFPTPYILNFAVTKYTSGVGSIVYACLKDGVEGGNHTGKLLRVFDNGTWYERSSGLPQSGAWVRNVAVHPTNNNIAYALMNGFSGQKIFRTTNRGTNWTNITGNLPNVPVSDLTPHPTDDNKLYLASQYGCFKTINGGVNWYTWNNGLSGRLPEYDLSGWNAAIVNDMHVIDSLAQNGRYYVLIATHGRGIWMREISGDDPIGITNNSVPITYKLSQNYPNPFNPSSKIDFSIPESSIIKLIVYDALGRVINELVNEKKTAGDYSIEFNGKKLSSGIYFYTLFADDEKVDTKKMILIK